MSESSSVPHVVAAAAFTPSVRVARMMETLRVAEMVSRLPDAVYAPEVDPLLQQAGLESFFNCVRSLIEFLELRRPKPSDFSATDVLPTWSPTVDAATSARLQDDWLNASRQVMHFSKDRVRSEAGPAVEVPSDAASLHRMADDVLGVWDQYADQVGHPLCPKRADFSLWR
ncbi:hypothetical protein [Nocardia sp. NPDC059239]|uniref:hypothetical protein n=1 Tax=Nocardia sp. NPDC059239 TaxID=3346785 RepID=UPI0036ACB92A